jgi:hypothetical protein
MLIFHIIYGPNMVGYWVYTFLNNNFRIGWSTLKNPNETPAKSAPGPKLLCFSHRRNTYNHYMNMNCPNFINNFSELWNSIWWRCFAKKYIRFLNRLATTLDNIYFDKVKNCKTIFYQKVFLDKISLIMNFWYAIIDCKLIGLTLFSKLYFFPTTCSIVLCINSTKNVWPTFLTWSMIMNMEFGGHWFIVCEFPWSKNVTS